MIHLLTSHVTPQQLTEMLEELKNYVKLAVDIEQNIVAGGGELHADCEAVLLENGSQQENIWGAIGIRLFQKSDTNHLSISVRDRTIRQ